MPINPQIPLMAGRNALAQRDPLRDAAAMQQLALQQEQMQTSRMDREQQNALRSEYAKIAQLPPEQREAAAAELLMRTGDPKAAIDLKKSSADLGSSKLKLAKERLALIGQLLGGVTDEGSYQAARRRGEQMGLEVADAPPNYNPEYVATLLSQVEDYSARLDREEKTRDYNLREDTQKDASARGWAGVGIQRGQLGISQANLGMRQKEFEATQKEKAGLGSIRPPAGFMPDPDKPGAIRPIPGSEPARKLAEVERKVKGAYRDRVAKANRVLKAIQTAKGQTGFFTTGMIGGIGSKIPGSEAFNLSKTIDTIKANVGFDALQNMRDNSPTGGALGQVSERENLLLQSTIANLEQSQSQDQFLENLKAVEDAYTESLRTVEQAFQQDFGGGTAPVQAVRRYVKGLGLVTPGLGLVTQ